MSESTFSCQHVGCSSLNAYLSRGTAVEDSFECFLGRIDPELKQHAASLRQEGYGSRKRLSAARLEELKAVPGVRPGDARLIYGYFRPELTEVRQFKSHMDIFRAEVRQMIAKPPAVTTITFRELGQNALKRPRLRLPLPPHKAVTWDDDVWQQLVQDQPRIGDQTFSGVQSALAQLLHTVPTNMPFQLHGVSSTPSVCGDDLKPDAVISLHGHPLTPVTTSCILFLKPPDAPCNTAENVGKAIVHGREFLQQLPSSLRQSVHVGLTDLHSIVLVQASYTDQDRREFRADVSEEHFDVKDVLLRFLNQDPLFAGVVLPLLGPNTKIMGFLDYGATSHVYRAIVDGREVVAKVPCGPSLQGECQTLVALQHVQGVPTLVNSTCVCGSILTADIFDPVTSSLIARSNLQRTFPSLVQTLQGAHESGFVNRDVRPNNIMVHSDSQQLYLIDWGTAVAANIGAVPFAGVPHYSSLRIISQLMCDEVGSYTKADDLEALVCSAFCCTHPSLQTELESFDKADFESIWDWWQGTAWQERPSWRKAIIAARATDYARVQKLLVKLME